MVHVYERLQSSVTIPTNMNKYGPLGFHLFLLKTLIDPFYTYEIPKLLFIYLFLEIHISDAYFYIFLLHPPPIPLHTVCTLLF